MHSGQVPLKLDQVALGLFHPSSETHQRWMSHHLSCAETATPGGVFPLYPDEATLAAAIVSHPPALHHWESPALASSSLP